MTVFERGALLSGGYALGAWTTLAVLQFLRPAPRPQPRPVVVDGYLGPCPAHNLTHCGRCRG